MTEWTSAIHAPANIRLNDQIDRHNRKIGSPICPHMEAHCWIHSSTNCVLSAFNAGLLHGLFIALLSLGMKTVSFESAQMKSLAKAFQMNLFDNTFARY